jgi:hypothetical protein
MPENDQEKDNQTQEECDQILERLIQTDPVFRGLYITTAHANERFSSKEVYFFPEGWRVTRENGKLAHSQYLTEITDIGGIRNITQTRVDGGNKILYINFSGFGSYEHFLRELSQPDGRSFATVTHNQADSINATISMTNFLTHYGPSSEKMLGQIPVYGPSGSSSDPNYELISVESVSWGNYNALKFVEEMLKRGKKVNWNIGSVANEHFVSRGSKTFFTQLESFLTDKSNPNLTNLTITAKGGTEQDFVSLLLHPENEMERLQNLLQKQQNKEGQTLTTGTQSPEIKPHTEPYISIKTDSKLCENAFLERAKSLFQYGIDVTKSESNLEVRARCQAKPTPGEYEFLLEHTKDADLRNALSNHHKNYKPPGPDPNSVEIAGAIIMSTKI